MSKILCDPYFWENSSILLQTPLFPSEYTRCMSDRINHIVFVGVLFGIIGAAVSWKLGMKGPLILAFFLACFVMARSIGVIFDIIRFREGFQNSDTVVPSVDVIGKDNTGIQSRPLQTETRPTHRNPFMNVLIDEMKYNPTRPPAASILDPSIRLTLDDFFRTEFFSDPTDVFGKSQSQREFITMPSTSIPNDVDSYQNWLYRIPGKTCKEGGPCLPGTDGAALPWLNEDSVPPLSDDEIQRAMVNRYPAPVNEGSGLRSDEIQNAVMNKYPAVANEGSGLRSATAAGANLLAKNRGYQGSRS